jgi:uncharacterized membrane protein YvlD (DUF360 family)
MCTVLLLSAVSRIAVNKYIYSIYIYNIVSYHIISYHISSYIISYGTKIIKLFKYPVAIMTLGSLHSLRMISGRQVLFISGARKHSSSVRQFNYR